MNIGLLTSSNPQLRQQLESAATPDARTEATESLVVAAPKPRPIVNVAPSTKFASMRAALDARIATDVASGQLSADGAAAVKTTLDAIDNRSAGSFPTADSPVPSGGYASPSSPYQAARAYLATVPRGTLIDRIG